jgi:CubicO group peptidase (beta-lactamase class C family)
MKKSILTLLFLTTFISLFGQSDDNRLKGIEEEIEKWMEAYKAVGLSIAIVDNKEILFNKSFGYRDIENKKPITENTVFPIASCSKAFTATLLGMLEAENKLSLTDRPSIHIPNLQFNTAEMNASISIADLLSHKSGLGNVNGTLVLFPENNRLKIMEKLKHIKTEGKVKESSLYSNLAYTVAGTIVEEVTKESWENNIQNKIFNPLEMTSSFTNLEKAKKTDNYAIGYGLYQNQIKQVNFEEYYDYKPAGGIRSTSKDLSNWMLAWLNNGKYKNTQVLPENFIKNARKFHNSRDGDDEPNLFFQGYGLGWRVEARDGEYRVQHGGNTSGFSTLVVTYPFRKFGVTVLVNQDDSILPYIIADIVQNRMLNKKQVNDYPVVVTDIYQPSERDESINNEKPTSKPLASFVGEYNNKGYGTVKIVLENDKLYAIYPTYKFFLEHIHYNTFKMKPLKDVSDIFNPEFAINFKMNENGEISYFTMNLQSEPVEFIRKNKE